MQDWKKRLITLHHCPQLSDAMLRKLVDHDPTLKYIFTRSPEEIAAILSSDRSKAEKIHHHLHHNNLDNLLLTYAENFIHPISFLDPEYPLLLKEIYDPPLVLYAKGNLSLMQTRMLGVVGTRLLTKYGQQAMNKIIPPIVKEKWTIVSGLAKGVDTFAHHLSIHHGGNTIAVLGSGILQIYPKENKALASHIADNHLLLSEYPPFSPPRKWHFPKRNRIISGLSEGVIIIEAKEKSGSLITADQAMEQGREVFAIPGSIVSETSSGTNTLIQQGAKLVLNHLDVLEELR